MIEDLQILNGTLALPFDKYVYEYTVNVDKTIASLVISYKLTEGSNIAIRNNSLEYGTNTVYVDVYNDTDLVTYTFLVYKEHDDLVSGIENYKNSLEVTNKDSFNILNVQILAVSIFMIIIIIFSLLFHKRKPIK